MLLQKLKKAKLKAVKAKDTDKRDAINMILGEVPRLNKPKNEKVTDQELIVIINKLVKSELITLKHAEINPDKSDYLKTLKSYLPKMMTEEEISIWVLDNITLSDYNIPIQAMKDVMKELKGKADGSLVKKVLTSGG